MKQDTTVADEPAFSLLYKSWVDELGWDGREQPRFRYRHSERLGGWETLAEDAFLWQFSLEK